MGMTAHVVYTAWDAERPASQSPIVIRDIIRERIGFDGFLMSDDIGMEALSGDHRAARVAACVAAGCDVALHCYGKMDEYGRGRERGAGDDRRRRSAAGAGDGDASASTTKARLRRSRGQAGRAAGAGLTVA